MSAKYYQKNKEGLQEKAHKKDIKISLKNKTKKRGNMVVKVKKISQMIKNKSLLSTEKNITDWEKTPYY